MATYPTFLSERDPDLEKYPILYPFEFVLPMPTPTLPRILTKWTVIHVLFVTLLLVASVMMFADGRNLG